MDYKPPRASAKIRPDEPTEGSMKEGSPSQLSAAEEQVDLLDYYLEHTSYAAQTFLSTRLAIHSVWRKLAVATTPQETKEKLKGFWTTMGVVSALLLSVTYGTAMNPVKTDDPDKKMAAEIATILGGLSLILSLAVIVFTVIYIIEIDNCITDKDLLQFIRNFGSLFDLLLGVFCASVILLMASAIATQYVTYSRTGWILMVVCAGSGGLCCGAIAAIIAGRNRFALWARIDSPLALERAKAKAAIGKQ